MTFTEIISFLKAWAVNFLLLLITVLWCLIFIFFMIWLMKTYGAIAWFLFLLALASGLGTYVLRE